MKWTSFLALLFIFDKAKYSVGYDPAAFAGLTVDKADCNPKATNETIEFLNGGGPSGGLPIEDSRLDLDKLKKYLAEVGYLDNPGKLFLANYQANTIKLECGDHDGAWDQLKTPHVNEISLQVSGKTVILSPSDREAYLKKYRCTDSNAKSKCNHTVYAITRPLPEVDFPLFFREEGEMVTIKCSLNPCFYKNKVEGKCYFPFKEAAIVPHPYKFQWAFPLQKGHSRYDMYDVGRRLYDENSKDIPYNIKIKSIKKTGSFSIRQADKNGSDITVSNPVEGSEMVIMKPQMMHDGVFECVITDANGVVSTPKEDSLPEDKRYKGRALIHIRNGRYTYIAIAVAFSLLAVALIMNFALPSRIEAEKETPEPSPPKEE